jgi:hypothetical protein
MRDYLDEAVKLIDSAEKATSNGESTSDPQFQVNAAIACALIDVSESLREVRQLLRSLDTSSVS